MDNLDYVTISKRRRARKAKYRRRRRILPLTALSAALVLLIIIAAVRCTGGTSSAKGGIVEHPAFPDSVDGIPVTTELLPEGYEGRPGKLREIKYVVIHDTDNTSTGANAKNHSKYLMDTAKETPLSWHYTVDDHEIYHHLPDNEIAYHASDKETEGGGNKNGVAVEICVNEDGDFEQSFKNGADLAAFLLYEYGLTPADLRQHNDFCGKNCPRTIRDSGRWDEFVSLVTQRYDKYMEEKPQKLSS